MMISCLLSWLTGLLNVVQYVVLMTTFLHWSLLATQELHRFCRYIAELDRLVWPEVCYDLLIFILQNWEGIKR